MRMFMFFLFDFGRSRTWPTDARTRKSPELSISFKYFSIVLALAGDSTITNFIINVYYYTEPAKRAKDKSKKEEARHYVPGKLFLAGELTFCRGRASDPENECPPW